MKRTTKKTRQPDSGEFFRCDCGGEVRVLGEALVWHACAKKYAPGTSYYDGVDRFIRYERVQATFRGPHGEPLYSWFVKWLHCNPPSAV